MAKSPYIEKLLSYLQAIRKLELDRLICENSISTIKTNLTSIFNEKQNKLIPTPEQPEQYYANKSDYFKDKPACPDCPSVFESIVRGFFLGCILFSILFLTVEQKWEYLISPEISTLPEIRSEANKIFVAIVGAAFMILTPIIFHKIRKASYEKKTLKTYNNVTLPEWESKCQAEYDAEVAECSKLNASLEKEYEASVRYANEENARINSNYKRKKMQYEERIRALEEQLTDLNKSLDTMYSANIVYEKYRGLVPITMFCEYLEVGRCSSLTGGQGAYNKYEEELRANIIIEKLNIISTKLDSIKQNQYMLYSSLSDVNRSVGLLSSQVEQNTHLSSHNTQLLAHKAEALATIEQSKLDELRALRNQIESH